MKRRPAAYIRRSSADAKNPGQFSREAQEDAVRRMAAADGDPDVEVFTDWGVSGGRSDRVEYLRLKAAIREGRVSRVYALNMSRIGRSLRELLDFVDLCREHEVTLRLDRDHLDTSTPSGRLAFHVLASVSQFVRELAAEAAGSALDNRRERGDVLGRAHYGFTLALVDGRYQEVPDPERPVQPVLDALRDAGSVAGAVRLLNERGVPPPMGGKRWHLSATRRVIDNAAPGLLERHRREHPRTHRPAVLAGVLKCHCGATMTPNPARGQYYCHRARIHKGHGKATIAERLLLPWIKAEAARFRTPERALVGGSDSTSERVALEAQRERLRTQHRLGVITDDELAAGWSDVRHAMDALDAQEAVNVVDIPETINWAATPETVNAHLRAIWDHVQLDRELRPVRAAWGVPPEYVA